MIEELINSNEEISGHTLTFKMDNIFEASSSPVSFPRKFELSSLISVCCFFLMFLIIFEGQRETEHEQRRSREREGDTEFKAGSRL